MKHEYAIKTIDINFNLHVTEAPLNCGSMKVYKSQDLSYVDSGLSCDTFNVIHITDGSRLTYTSLEASIKYFRRKSLDFCLWVNFGNLNTKVFKYLKKLGLSEQNQEVGMLFQLDQYTPVVRDEHKNISIVQHQNSLSEYAKAIAENWSPPDINISRFYEWTSSFYLKEKVVTLLQYKLDGKTVSTVELFETDPETIGFYGFTTLKAYRGLGIGSSLLTYSLNLAKERGYKNAVLQGTQAGLAIYKKLGFKEYTTYFEFA